MNPPTDQQAALPLHELEIVPQWVRAPTKSSDERGGGSTERRRTERGPDRQRRRHGPSSQVVERPPRKPPATRPRDDKAGPRRAQPQTAPLSLPVEVTFLPEEKGFAAMIETMKQSARAYALFDIAKLVLNKPDRHIVRLTRKPGVNGTHAPLFLVLASENPFLSLQEALRFVFRRHAEQLFKETKKPIDPPKGNFAFVNRCGVTGEILGPPNYHEYQTRLVRHHQQRLRHIPFEKFKAQLQTVRDPEAVKAWIESKSFVAEYQCLLDAEPPTFPSREELEMHVTNNHLPQLVTQAPEVRISGTASRQIAHGGILEAIRQAWVAERKFPLRTAGALSERLRKEGFHFFKRDKGVTFISRIKPQHLQAAQELTEHVQKIVAFLRARERCTRKELFAALLPQPVPVVENVPASQGPISPEEERLLADLHWLIQDGYVVEFANGRLWVPDQKHGPPPTPTPPATSEPTPQTSAPQEPTREVAQGA